MKRTITNNQILFTCKGENTTMSLHKQSYSNNTCFYTLRDKFGNWSTDCGSKDLNKLIEQLQNKIKRSLAYQNKDFNRDNESIKIICDNLIEFYKDVIINITAIQ